jgi:hypothetical protein
MKLRESASAKLLQDRCSARAMERGLRVASQDSVQSMSRLTLVSTTKFRQHWKQVMLCELKFEQGDIIQAALENLAI